MCFYAETNIRMYGCAFYMAIRDCTVARSPGIITTIRIELRNSEDTSRRKKRYGIVGDHFSRVAIRKDEDEKWRRQGQRSR